MPTAPQVLGTTAWNAGLAIGGLPIMLNVTMELRSAPER